MLRLVAVGLLLEVVLQLVIARAESAVWLFLLSVAHLQPNSAAAAIVVPSLLMQTAAGYATARATSLRSWLPDATILLAIVGALTLVGDALVSEPLRPHAWQVVTGLLIVCAGTAAGIALRMRTAVGSPGARGGRYPSYGTAAPVVPYGDGRGSAGHTDGGAR